MKKRKTRFLNVPSQTICDRPRCPRPFGSYPVWVLLWPVLSSFSPHTWPGRIMAFVLLSSCIQQATAVVRPDTFMPIFLQLYVAVNFSPFISISFLESFRVNFLSCVCSPAPTKDFQRARQALLHRQAPPLMSWKPVVLVHQHASALDIGPCAPWAVFDMRSLLQLMLTVGRNEKVWCEHRVRVLHSGWKSVNQASWGRLLSPAWEFNSLLANYQ